MFLINHIVLYFHSSKCVDFISLILFIVARDTETEQESSVT